jgi:hypothetical protein
MTFDYTKFLAENDLTTTARLRSKFLKEEAEPDQTPDAGSVAGQDAGNASAKLQDLIAQKDEILAKYKNGEISLDQYKTQIGNIPQQIKQIKIDLDSELNPEAGEDEEGGENIAINQTPDKDTDVSGVEDTMLRQASSHKGLPNVNGDNYED